MRGLEVFFEGVLVRARRQSDGPVRADDFEKFRDVRHANLRTLAGDLARWADPQIASTVRLRRARLGARGTMEGVEVFRDMGKTSCGVSITDDGFLGTETGENSACDTGSSRVLFRCLRVDLLDVGHLVIGSRLRVTRLLHEIDFPGQFSTRGESVGIVRVHSRRSV
jgi:hypothetical protein